MRDVVFLADGNVHFERSMVPRLEVRKSRFGLGNLVGMAALQVDVRGAERGKVQLEIDPPLCLLGPEAFEGRASGVGVGARLSLAFEGRGRSREFGGERISAGFQPLSTSLGGCAVGVGVFEQGLMV